MTISRRNLLVSCATTSPMTSARLFAPAVLTGSCVRAFAPSAARVLSVGFASTIVIPRDAHAFVPNGVLFATTLLALFFSHGLRQHHVSALERSNDVPSPTKVNTFHGSLDDNNGPEWNGGFKFEGGRIVGVANTRAHASHKQHGNMVTSSFNRAELLLSSSPETISQWGSLTPTTIRTAVGPELTDGFKSALGRRAQPVYARGWTNFDRVDEKHIVVIGNRGGELVAHVAT